MMTSCATSKKSSQNTTLFRCAVESGAETVFAILLDGKLVSSGKTVLPGKGVMMVDLVATPGDHALAVTAQGYGTWHKTITVLDGIKYGPVFLVELKKSE